MKLALVEKQAFYHELGQFLRSGIPLQQAAEALAAESRGSVRRLLEELRDLFLQGQSVPEAFTRLQPGVGSMEVALIAASDSSGRLEQAFEYLANYFGALAAVRAGIIKQALWPVIQLHLGILLMNGVGQFVGTGGFDAGTYLVQCGAAFGVIYGAAFILWLVSAALVRNGRTNLGVDWFLGRLPILGKIRRNMALNRFCAVYEMQLQAAINVMDSLRAAADASQSARIRAAIARIVPGVQAGSQVGPLITGESVFPPALQRAFRIGEDTGSLDEDLRRWALYYHTASVSALEALGSWLPRFVFLLIALYLGYKIVSVYSLMYGQIERIGDFTS